MKNRVERIQFRGIDGFHRAVFRSLDYKRNFFGCTSPLFELDDGEDEVLAKISEKNLCFFGNRFGCEPTGTPAENIKIIRKGNE